MYRIILIIILILTFVSPGFAELQNPDNPWTDPGRLQIPDPVVGAVSSRSLNRALAFVGDTVITLRDYKGEYGDTQLSERRLEQMIDQELVKVAADEMEISVSEQHARQLAERQVQSIIEARGEDEYRKFLRQENVTQEEFLERKMAQSRSEILTMQVMARSFPDLGEPDTFAAATRMSGRLMIITERSLAQEIYEKLLEDSSETNWNRLFREHSLPRFWMGENGRLGWFGWGSYHPEIEYRIFKLDLYDVSEPFEYRGDYLIVWKTGKRFPSPGDEPAVEILNYYENLRQQYYHQRLLDLLRNHYAVYIPDSVRREMSGEN